MHEFNQLDKMAQLMVEKREKESQLSNTEEDLATALEELRSTKLQILDIQKEWEEKDQSYKVKLFE